MDYRQLVLSEIHEAISRVAEDVGGNENLTNEEVLGVPMLLLGLEEVLRRAAIKYMDKEGKGEG